jgi:hypothetical protein
MFAESNDSGIQHALGASDASGARWGEKRGQIYLRRTIRAIGVIDQ